MGAGILVYILGAAATMVVLGLCALLIEFVSGGKIHYTQTELGCIALLWPLYVPLIVVAITKLLGIGKQDN